MLLRLITILLSSFIVCSNMAFAEEVKKKNELSDTAYLKQFHEVFERINKDYVQEPEKQKMTDAAIEGMLTSLDPHSSYFTDDDLKDFLNDTKGEFGGIGVEVQYDNGAIKVVSPIDDLPAYKAGIKAGDYIVGVNDELVTTLGFPKSVKEMRGEPGSKVKLLVITEDESKAKEIELTREIVTIHPVKSHLEKNNIAYVRIVAFNEHTIEELKKAIKTLNNSTKDGIKGFILDLRSNPGGLLDQAVAVSEYFIDSGVILTTKGRTKNSNATFSSKKSAEKAPTVPIIALINSGSASAAEIVAGSLQDHKRAIILGTKSFGKGSVQSFALISPRAAIKLTTAKYYTPSGRSIQAEGIEPDIIVENIKVDYPEKKIMEGRFESSLRNYLKNDNKKTDSTDKEATKKTDDITKDKDKTKKTESKNTLEQLSDLYKKDYQFARAYDLIMGLILTNKSELKK
ncbi:MAG: S41 family peptidase [Rickettsia endosymbiont of Pseudomimeciton antennatum]|nr:S41 family peptidase [Rickettsia endosymbiont of Pseudomimeciton antennatum]MCC8398486.1 S41 family peptidase [Rickettsia endosymbiont of Labidopullus appendiculatus]